MDFLKKIFSVHYYLIFKFTTYLIFAFTINKMSVGEEMYNIAYCACVRAV